MHLLGDLPRLLRVRHATAQLTRTRADTSRDGVRVAHRCQRDGRCDFGNACIHIHDIRRPLETKLLAPGDDAGNNEPATNPPPTTNPPPPEQAPGEADFDDNEEDDQDESDQDDSDHDESDQDESDQDESDANSDDSDDDSDGGDGHDFLEDHVLKRRGGAWQECRHCGRQWDGYDASWQGHAQRHMWRRHELMTK